MCRAETTVYHVCHTIWYSVSIFKFDIVKFKINIYWVFSFIPIKVLKDMPFFVIARQVQCNTGLL